MLLSFTALSFALPLWQDKAIASVQRHYVLIKLPWNLEFWTVWTRTETTWETFPGTVISVDWRM